MYLFFPVFFFPLARATRARNILISAMELHRVRLLRIS